MTDRAVTRTFRAARDFLLEHRLDYDAARAGFSWPELTGINWASDWFDALAEGNDAAALRVVEDDGSERRLSFSELARRSTRVAAWLAEHGVRRGDSVMLMLGNTPELWEISLACAKLGAVVVPTATLISARELLDRCERGAVRHVVAAAADAARLAVLAPAIRRVLVGPSAAAGLAADELAAAGGAQPALDYLPAAEHDSSAFEPAATAADELLMLYFTSGTTAQPKLVEHTHYSAPVGHLSTMYWIGLRPGDTHLNVSSPGWAKHGWSSFFAPWNAGATVLAYNYARFDARALLDVLVGCQVTTFCAPPTVWRMLIQQPLGDWQVQLREAVSAGEPLNPEVIERVRQAWGITVRDGFGQTETTAVVGNTPGQPVKPGSMGRALPGYRVTLLDPLPAGGAGAGEAVAGDGEISVDLADGGRGVMAGYRVARAGALERPQRHYRTGDIASIDADGYITYVGRADDVFKSSDYRVSPFELESVLIEHEAVAEAAVVPSPDALRLSVPKAYVALVAGSEPSAELAASIFGFVRDRVPPYKRVRRLAFVELPKTISGKIRRVELREAEARWRRDHGEERATLEYWEADVAT